MVTFRLPLVFLNTHTPLLLSVGKHGEVAPIWLCSSESMKKSPQILSPQGYMEGVLRVGSPYGSKAWGHAWREKKLERESSKPAHKGWSMTNHANKLASKGTKSPWSRLEGRLVGHNRLGHCVGQNSEVNMACGPCSKGR